MLMFAGGLVYFALSSIEVGEGENKSQFLWRMWESADKSMLVLMTLVAMVSHIIRAERWRMLLVPAGASARLGTAFLAVMVGYLVNLVIPRGGEVSRALNLYKTDDVKPEVSFGTVVTERIIDVIFLLSFVLISFLVEWDKLLVFLSTLRKDNPNNLPATEEGFTVPVWLWVVSAVVILLVWAGFRLRKQERFRRLWEGFSSGMFSIFRLDRKALFIFYSLMIWILYFVTTWLVMQAFEQTNALGFEAVLMIFALGSISMAVPLPGGTGSYHTIVPLGLVAFYGLGKSDAVALVFIFHALQTLILLLFGLLSLLITLFFFNNRKGI